jgi:putative cell wall-binding protein
MHRNRTPFLAALGAALVVAPLLAAPAAAAPSTTERAYTYFSEKGYTDAQAAGIVGNLIQESGDPIDPAAIQAGGKGRGVGQWSIGDRWDTAVSGSKVDNVVGYVDQLKADGSLPASATPWQLGPQLDFIDYELDTFNHYGARELGVRAGYDTPSDTDPVHAAMTFQEMYERCGTCHAPKRIDYTISVLERSDPGSEALKPQLTRLSGDNRYATNAMASETLSPYDKTQRVYVASGEEWADALAAGPVAGPGGWPVLLTDADRLSAETAGELKRLRPNEIVVVGGTGAVSERVVRDIDALSQVPANATFSRLEGDDRYGTAAELSRHAADPRGGTVYLASGVTYADGLAAAPRAAAENATLLLTQRDEVPQATLDRLNELDPRRIVIVGGKGAISQDVFLEVKYDQSYATPDVVRIGGDDRYETAALLAQGDDGKPNVWGSRSPAVFVTSGENFPDAVSAAPVAAYWGAPILLTRAGCQPQITWDMRHETLDMVSTTVLGGQSVAHMNRNC